jgi:hypothetical protein
LTSGILGVDPIPKRVLKPGRFDRLQGGEIAVGIGKRAE